MYICLSCGSVFSEGVSRTIDSYPYQESYAKQYGCTCPECGDTEFVPAFKCSRCGDYFPIDEECSPTEEPMCPACAAEAEEELAEEREIMANEAYLDYMKDEYCMNPYSGITDPFKLFDRLFEV